MSNGWNRCSSTGCRARARSPTGPRTGRSPRAEAERRRHRSWSSRARATRVVSGRPGERRRWLEGAVRLALLVGRGTDRGERYEGGLDVALVVKTEGVRGGVANGRRYDPASPPAPIVDTYGAGDSFGAALTFALGRGDELEDALALAAQAGASVITGKGPYIAQLELDAH